MSSTTKLSMILLHDRRAAWLGHAQNLGAKCTLNFNTLQIHVKPSQRLSQNQNFCFRQMRTSPSFFTDVHSGIASLTPRCHGRYRQHGIHVGGTPPAKGAFVSHEFQGMLFVVGPSVRIGTGCVMITVPLNKSTLETQYCWRSGMV